MIQTMVKKVATAEVKQKILNQLHLFEGKKVLIVGDIGIDEYVLGQVRRISPEAPVPVLDVEGEDCRLGLSGNVAQNIVSLGGQVVLVSVVGQDTGANSLKNLLIRQGVSPAHLVVDPKRPTTRKMRVMAQHHHLVRVDYELRHFLEPEIENKLIDEISSIMTSVDIVILQDYAKGVISRKVIEQVVELAHKFGKKVLMDPHRANPASYYRGVDLLKPNFEESLALAGITYEDYKLHKKNIFEVGQILREKVQAQQIVITQGKEGMSIFCEKEVHQVPTYARQVFDVTGAGDTVIAAIGLGLAAGWNIDEACVLANFAAGVVVGKVGCVPCLKEDLIEYISTHPVT